MFKRAAILALAFGLATTSVASAQQTTAPPPNQASTNPQVFIAPAPQPFNSLEVDAWRRIQTIRAEARSKSTPEQWRRAQQAASLINANQCANAYKLAVIEQDNQLAETVKATCSGRTRG